MATKKPAKAAKPAPKKPTPAKKAAPASKGSNGSANKQSPKGKVADKPAGKANKQVAKPAPKSAAKPVTKSAGNLNGKTPAPMKKAVTPAIKPGKAPAKSASPTAKKAAPKPVVQQKKAEPVKEVKKPVPQPTKATPQPARSLPKKAEPEREMRKPEEAPAPRPSGKTVVVPSKPAINPKVAFGKKPEPVRSNKPVVIPKTHTDKKVDYEPEFTKSVLDTPVQQSSGPTMRYSDTELQEFRDLINKKLDAAKKELAYLQGLITRKDEMGGDETDNRYMTMEDGSMSMEREQLSQMASRQITFIDHLEKAIMRIENKTYGICRVTGKLIDKARLRAVPHATLSMEAKLGIVK